jgi:hypothetical protein
MHKINTLFEVVLESLDLMHPLVQDGDDPDVAIGKAFPVHEMALVAEEVPFHPELGRHGPRHHTASFNPL